MPLGEVRVVAAAIVRDGRVLAALRGPGRARAGTWELPGGKVEPGESDAVALAREIREELGLDLTVGDAIGESVHAYDDLVVRLVAYACAAPTGEPRPTEHAAVRWLAGSELEAVDWAPADRALVSAVSARLR